jgi:hypothetical protein
MISRAERLFEMRRTILAYRNETVGETGASFTPHAVQTLTNRLSDRCRHALSGQCCKLLH